MHYDDTIKFNDDCIIITVSDVLAFVCAHSIQAALNLNDNKVLLCTVARDQHVLFHRERHAIILDEMKSY